MAKFRQNHARNTRGASNMIRVVIFLAVIGGILVYLLRNMGNFVDFKTNKNDSSYTLTTDEVRDSLYYIPSNSSGQIVKHKHYTLSYIEKYEQAEWVAYVLTKPSLQKPNVPRAKRFNQDPKVSTKSAHYYDYKGSGYSRGHLAPAGDMAFSTEAMQASFNMSNMSPQKIPFNGGIWNELENHVRDWAYKNKRLFVVTGPIFQKNMKYIGRKNKVAVPAYFYKVLLDIDSPKQKAIGFILPNEKSDEPLENFAVTVDEVERQTGLNFYDFLIDEAMQEQVESSFDIAKWPMSKSLYKKRVEVWNNRN